MEDLCTSCLCRGRKLQYIFDTKLLDLFIQILNENALFYTSPQTSIRICWECFSMLKKFKCFKQQVQNSYAELLKHIQESTQVEPKPSRFVTQCIYSIQCSEIKPEHNNDYFDYDITNLIQFKNVSIVHLTQNHCENDDIKSNAIQDTGCVKKNECEETSFGDVMNDKYDHCEETFVDEISVPTKKKKAKRKIKSKKVTNKKNKDDSNSETVPLKINKEIYTDINKEDNVKFENNKNEIYLPSVTENDRDIKSEDFIEDSNDFDTGNYSDNDSTGVDTKDKIQKDKGKCKKLVKNKEYVTVDLSVEEMQALRETDRQSRPFENAKHKCDTCVVWFYNKQSHLKHMKLKHDSSVGDFKCPVCECFAVNFESFAAHYSTHMKAYECKLCKKRTSSTKLMHRHYLFEHLKAKEYKCQECGKLCNNSDAYKNHLQRHKGRIPCPRCDKTFTHRAGLNNHNNSVHSKTSHQCPHCSKTFRYKPSVTRHIAHSHSTPAVEKQPYCVTCDLHFASDASLTRHLATSLRHVSPDDFRFICNDCNKRFVDKTKLRNHIESKHLHRTFHCTVCSKIFKNYVNLDQHVRNVHKGRPNNKICHHCGRGFPTRSQLECHIRSHTGERPFICEFCPTTFSQQSNLYKHYRQVHLNIKSKKGVREEKKTLTEPLINPIENYFNDVNT